jgi:hypothetical protein
LNSHLTAGQRRWAGDPKFASAEASGSLKLHLAKTAFLEDAFFDAAYFEAVCFEAAFFEADRQRHVQT